MYCSSIADYLRTELNCYVADYILSPNIDKLAEEGVLFISALYNHVHNSFRQNKSIQVFISVDDLNDWIGVLGGYTQAITPNIDALAKRGVLFTNAHFAAPLCGPSRAALMTRITPASSGIHKNNQLFRGSPVLRDAVTLPQHFMNNGYKAIGAGKIYHVSDPDPASWDDYWPSQEKNEPKDPKPDENSPLKKEYYHFGSPLGDVGSEEMDDWRSADRVTNQLQSAHDKPLFLAYGVYKPHLPITIKSTLYAPNIGVISHMWMIWKRYMTEKKIIWNGPTWPAILHFLK